MEKLALGLALICLFCVILFFAVSSWMDLISRRTKSKKGLPVLILSKNESQQLDNKEALDKSTFDHAA